MKYLITIDAGTSNTRAFLWKGEALAGCAARAVGVRNTAIEGNDNSLKTAIQMCIQELLERESLREDAVTAVMASGMLTSELGLLEIEHLTVPAGKKTCATGTVKRNMPEICKIPICFIPGVKNLSECPGGDDLELMDIMRGEEVEAFALVEACFDGAPMLLILPGSHYKYVSVNCKREITSCMTTLTGEILRSLTCDTILADSVNRKFLEADRYQKDVVVEGYRTAKRSGFSRACFSARIRSMYTESDSQMTAAFLLGVVLEEEIRAVLQSRCLSVTRDTKVVIAGNQVVGRAMADLIAEEDCFTQVEVVCPEIPLAATGARLIAEEIGLF